MTPEPSGGEAVSCPHCGAPVDPARASTFGAVSRLGCLRCGVQLVKRGDGPWETIRG